ncbi:hypothetical protein A2763_02930 [Candidatus Kaiserbacteria bacterium RIFCSPHIGHO2_01_FULL_54_36]|uniref:Disulfide bond formation protein DsbB n=1 Tax=Candidatus Kaiserbacteria bacterium RIFCSPHIGHO2_01_FULL_54_36 TaxID=1798482 RepID=A0A1F6CKE9_9BACT|nr:MAG: hypothetical protein A2763_02930 [Candidatus Kaiserbacteria bacterium RIFCSPHIGHO2_01_FULL_54_36]OGG75359.1 MAG: hypothetical protein A3A41_02185 [Candidatus Kaiserbacteria bacterium RIFCSPLOWO2_01_FULL_54_22]
MHVETLNYLLGLATIVLQILTVAFLAVYFLRHQFPDLEGIVSYLRTWGIGIAFLASAGASIVTVVHSGIFGLPPCPLCWWQRAFLYPQVVMFGIAVLMRDRVIAGYSIALSIIGLMIGVYHHVLQMYPTGSLPCPSEGGVSCGQILFLQFGYITYPMMSISAFAFLIVLMLFVRSTPRAL